MIDKKAQRRLFTMLLDPRFLTMLAAIGFFILANDVDSLHESFRIGKEIVEDAILYR